MKKIVITLIFIAAYAMGLAQEFKIPELTMEQKHNRTLYLAHSFVFSGIANAKAAGMSIDEYADFVAGWAKTTWNKEMGFEGFIKGTLYNWETLRRASDPPIEIMEQNPNRCIFKCKNNFKEIFQEGPVFGVTHEEMFTWYKVLHQRIGEYLGVGFEMDEMDGDWIKMTFTKME
ncbi:MAG: hypothetical protein KGY69_17285 [Bacteroidales bacterium]|nr:hypothetical protein [Bacteroidales bacterium]